MAILLRMVPRMKREARRIYRAQQGIGQGANQGNPFRRLRNCLRIFSILVIWTMESLVTASESMRSRGSTLRGRTTFSTCCFDNRDQAFVGALFACLAVTGMAVLLRQTDMLYNSRILWSSATPVSCLFWGGYAALCLMPLALELWTEYRFRKATVRL